MDFLDHISQLIFHIKLPMLSNLSARALAVHSHVDIWREREYRPIVVGTCVSCIEPGLYRMTSIGRIGRGYTLQLHSSHTTKNPGYLLPHLIYHIHPCSIIITHVHRLFIERHMNSRSSHFSIEHFTISCLNGFCTYIAAVLEPHGPCVYASIRHKPYAMR